MKSLHVEELIKSFLLHVSMAVFMLLAAAVVRAQVRLPALIGDGMVLQRNTPLTIWGWASPGENVVVFFNDEARYAAANQAGYWQVQLKPLEAGGPYNMVIRASNTVYINDILVGDVWICSGQSNMELPMRRMSWVYPDEIAQAENTSIRQFYVPRAYVFNAPQDDLRGGTWIAANPETVLNFSATAYFFARQLYETYEIPIGLINTAYGGSTVEAWISEDALKKFPQHFDELQRMKDDELVRQIREDDQLRIAAWHRQLRQDDLGYSNPELPWFMPAYDASEWNSINIPGYWAQKDPDLGNGVVWFRKTIALDSVDLSDQALLVLGCIVDSDSVYVNGQFVGTTGYQYPPRRYSFPANVLTKGNNVIAIRVISEGGRGGFVPDKEYSLHLGSQKVDLRGTWKYRQGAEMPPLQGRTFFNNKPGGLYNAMVHPLINYSVKGFVWYQGESNVERYRDYQALFAELIADWRARWGQPNAPFIFVQLPNFQEPPQLPGESNWARLREAQLNTLAIQNTGMAVAIDIGEWNDIHPLNKKDIGYRLSLVARKLAYEAPNIDYSGPVYHNMQVKDGQVILTFSHIGSGLVAQNNTTLRQFAIAGKDRQFVWANAVIRGEHVIVWHDDIAEPVAVRYAWSDNPEGANLYNAAGLPASPFRTDDW